jgi:Arm domain-containing DNA-binding protein
VPLKRAREKRDEARKLIADEIDPSAERKAKRATLLETFEGVAKEWLELQSKSLAPENDLDPWRASEQRALPVLGQ